MPIKDGMNYKEKKYYERQNEEFFIAIFFYIKCKITKIKLIIPPNYLSSINVLGK